jgi:hypothetical protein
MVLRSRGTEADGPVFLVWRYAFVYDRSAVGEEDFLRLTMSTFRLKIPRSTKGSRKRPLFFIRANPKFTFYRLSAIILGNRTI